MLRDVFYYGIKPNVHPREKFAKNLKDARDQATTEYFWIINEYCDYTNFDWDFDFDFLPDDDVWAQDHNNVWPSQHQKDSGTWLCPKKISEVIIYRSDVDIVRRKPIKENFVILQKVDTSKFDFSWHPDPTDPPYIYCWGNKFFPPQFGHALEYHVKNATEVKYMSTVVELLPNLDNYEVFDDIEFFDFSWIPDPGSPPYIYVWGNQWNKPEDKISIKYVVEGATEYKYMRERVTRKPSLENWELPKNINSNGFDFSWEPSPADPPYIYEFGTQWQKTGGPRYVVADAIEFKYIDFQKVISLPSKDQWVIPNNIEIDNFDFSWHPDNTDPAYIYQFGTQWALSGGPKYVVEGATEIKYVDDLIAIALPNKENWVVPIDIDESSFDFSWHPYAEDEPYIYQFGTQWQKTGGPKYITPGTTGVSATKYIDVRILKSKRLPTMNNWVVPKNIVIKSFDYSWHPDATDELFVYEFGTQWHEKGGPKYVPPGAKIGITPTKYIPTTSCVAILDINMKHWEVPNNIDRLNFDYSWVPHPDESTYIYQFGTQHQKTGGPKYITMGSNNKTPVKYIETLKAIALPNKSKFKILQNLKIKDFDYSWHPDETEQPYIYIFGNNQHTAEVMPTIEYKAGNATEIK